MREMSKKTAPVVKPVALMLSSIVMTGPAIAEEPQADTMPTVTVTASPIIESNNVDQFSALQTKVTEAQIEDMGALDLPDALRMTPGVQISLDDAVGNYSGNQGGSVYIRGMGTSRPGSEIKTYIDGMPVYMGLWNHPLMDLLPLNAMQAIDVNKGPQPQLNGNNFGSINLQTKTPQQEGLSGEVNAAGGSFDTRVFQGDLLGRYALQGGNSADFLLAGGYTASDGYRANGGAELSNALAKFGLQLGEAWRIETSYIHVDNHVGDPGDDRYPTSYSAIGPYMSNGVAKDVSSMDMGSLDISHKYAQISGDVRIYGNQGENNLFNDPTWGTFFSNFNTFGVHWHEGVTPWTGGAISGGIEYDDVGGSMSGPNVGAKVGTPYAFGQAGSASVPTFAVVSPFLGMSQKFDLAKDWVVQPSAGIRYYDSNFYAAEWAPNAGLSLTHGPVTVYGNYAVGILYPGAETYALTRALPMAFAANNDWDTISPERDTHFELGAKWDATSSTHIDVNLFHDDISERYVWSGFVPNATAVWSNNFPDYSLEGIETSVRQEIGSQWTVFGGVTGLSPSIQNVPYAPGTAFSLGTTGRFLGLKLTADLQHQTRMYSLTWDRGLYNAAPVDVGAFTVANARLAYPVTLYGTNTEFYALVNNIFNEKYEYNIGYPMPGANFRLGITTKF